MNDDRDAWLDDVRRWYYGGTPPHDPQPTPEPARTDCKHGDGPPTQSVLHQHRGVLSGAAG